jgi:hypothetical protein
MEEIHDIGADGYRSRRICAEGVPGNSSLLAAAVTGRVFLIQCLVS